MFLQYDDVIPGHQVQVLTNSLPQQLGQPVLDQPVLDQHRIELYILRNNDERYSLVALAGTAGIQPGRVKLQGPFEVIDQAVAARAAIVQQLKTKGFQSVEEVPIWAIPAQRIIRELRDTCSAAQGDYTFKPEDVYFD